MKSLIISNPVLSSPFLGHKISSSRGDLKRLAPNGLLLCQKAKCAMDTSYGGNVSKFPRSNVWDPYKRLGITTDASEEEVWSSRNFLLDQYAGHERSVESIEAAFEKILMTSFLKRKKTKINLKSRLKKQVEESPPWVQNLISFVEVPEKVIIIRRLFLFAFMACWSVNSSAEGGPAFQYGAATIKRVLGGGSTSIDPRSAFENSCSKCNIKGLRPQQLMDWTVALSLIACIYFLHEKTKSLARASIIGLGSLVVGWICGSCLVPMIPSVLLQPTWSLELLTSLVAYIFLFVGCTFLK